jgi:6-phosphogluconolactonase
MRIEDHPDLDAFADAVAGAVAEALGETLRDRGRAVFAASGGRTPIVVYQRLAQAPLDWSQVTVIPTDERCVPEDHPDSNARMLREYLLAGPASAARLTSLEAPTPKVDVALVGMGADGHFASLFPHSPALLEGLDPESAQTCVAVPVGTPPDGPVQARVSLTLAALARARVVLAFTGADKAQTLARALAGEDLPVRTLLRYAPKLRVMRAD